MYGKFAFTSRSRPFEPVTIQIDTVRLALAFTHRDSQEWLSY